MAKALRALYLMTRYAPAVITKHQVAERAVETPQSTTLVIQRPSDSTEKVSAPEGQSSGPGSNAQNMMQAKKPVVKKAAVNAVIVWTWVREGTRADPEISCTITSLPNSTRYPTRTDCNSTGGEFTSVRVAQH